MSQLIASQVERTELLRGAYRGRHPGRLHDPISEGERVALWKTIESSPVDSKLGLHRDALLQTTLSLIPGVALAGTALRGRSDERVLRHWQSTGRRPSGLALYRLSAWINLIGIFVTGLMTLGAGLWAAYAIMKRDNERLVFHRSPRARRAIRKGRRRRSKR